MSVLLKSLSWFFGATFVVVAEFGVGRGVSTTLTVSSFLWSTWVVSVVWCLFSTSELYKR